MADEICNQIDENIKNFVDEEDGCIRKFQRITDEATNREHFNDNYEDFKYTCDDLHGIKYPIEDLIKYSTLSDEDADRIVTKLEELISAEKPLFDHFNKYFDDDVVLSPWENISPSGDTSRDSWAPGHLLDLFDYHNFAWKQIGEHLYTVPSVQKRIYDDVIKFEDYEYTGRSVDWNP